RSPPAQYHFGVTSLSLPSTTRTMDGALSTCSPRSEARAGWPSSVFRGAARGFFLPEGESELGEGRFQPFDRAFEENLVPSIECAAAVARILHHHGLGRSLLVTPRLEGTRQSPRARQELITFVTRKFARLRL